MITKESTLDDVLSLNPFLINIAERFLLPYRNTSQTIQQAAECSRNNPDFVVEIIKAYTLKEDYPLQELKNFPPATIIEYLRKTHKHYLFKLLPQMEQSIAQITSKFSTIHPDLLLLSFIFLQFKGELEDHIQKEEAMLFPYLENLLKVKQHGQSYWNHLFNDYSIHYFMEDHTENETVFDRIRNILTGSSIQEIPMPFRIFLIQLDMFENDLHIHSKVENEILIPKGYYLEKMLRKRFERN